MCGSFCSSRLAACGSFCSLRLAACGSFCSSRLATCGSFCSSRFATCSSFCGSQLTTLQALWSVTGRTNRTNWCPVGQFLWFTTLRVMPSELICVVHNSEGDAQWVGFCGSQLSSESVSVVHNSQSDAQWVSFCGSQLTRWLPVSRFLWFTADKVTPSESVCVVHNSQHAAGSVQGYKEGKWNKVTPCYLVAVSSVCGLQHVWQCWHLSLWLKLLPSVQCVDYSMFGSVDISVYDWSCCRQFSVWTTACLAVLTSQSMIEAVAVSVWTTACLAVLTSQSVIEFDAVSVWTTACLAVLTSQSVIEIVAVGVWTTACLEVLTSQLMTEVLLSAQYVNYSVFGCVDVSVYGWSCFVAVHSGCGLLYVWQCWCLSLWLKPFCCFVNYSLFGNVDISVYDWSGFVALWTTACLAMLISQSMMEVVLLLCELQPVWQCWYLSLWLKWFCCFVNYSLFGNVDISVYDWSGFVALWTTACLAMLISQSMIEVVLLLCELQHVWQCWYLSVWLKWFCCFQFSTWATAPSAVLRPSMTRHLPASARRSQTCCWPLMGMKLACSTQRGQCLQPLLLRCMRACIVDKKST